MTWDWWVTHTHLTAHIFTLLWSQQIWMNTRTPVCVFQGKTLTTIALILTNFHKGKPLPVEKCVSVAVYECVFCNRVTCLHQIVCLHVCRRSSLHLSKSKLNHRWPPIWKVLSTFTKLAGCRFEHGHSCMPENRNRALTGEVMWRLNFSKHQCRRQSSGDWCSSCFFMLRPVSVISLNLACSDYIVSDVGFFYLLLSLHNLIICKGKNVTYCIRAYFYIRAISGIISCLHCSLYVTPMARFLHRNQSSFFLHNLIFSCVGQSSGGGDLCGFARSSGDCGQVR